MSKKTRSIIILLALVLCTLILPALCLAQDIDASAVEGPGSSQPSGGFVDVVFGSGWVGVLLWSALLGDSIAAAWLTIDFFITISPKRITPPELVGNVRAAMEEGDLMRAIEICEATPGTVSSILMAGFRNVKEGFEVIQEQVGIAADLESEKLMQRVAYLNMCGSIAPMLGLLGTVQGMIMAFGNLGSASGAAQQALLAINISMALWTTAIGLVIAIPSVSFYTYFKNRLSRIILNMEGMTMDLIKALRNVEVVED